MRGIKQTQAIIATLIIGVFGFLAIVVTGASNVRHTADSVIALYFLLWALVILFSNVPREEMRKRFVLMTLTIVSCLLFFEVPSLLGMVDYRNVLRTPGLQPWEELGRAFDPELLWVSKPHYHTKVEYSHGNLSEFLCLPPNPRKLYDLKYDRNGFRNDADLEQADIAVIGDSYVESPMTPTAALMTSVLTGLHGTAVANLGMSGYGPQQELAVLKRYALNLSPKTVVWMFYEGNDLGDVHRYKRQIAGLSDGANLPLVPWMRSFTRNALISVSRIPVRMPRACVPNEYFAKRYAILQEPAGSHTKVHFPLDGLPLSESDNEALFKTGSVLAEAYRLCRERGIRLVVVFVPAEYRVYNGLPNIVEVSDVAKGWIVNDLPERLREILMGISPEIDYLDLTAMFRAAAANGTMVYLPDDTHWTSEGHRLAAHALHQLNVGSPKYMAKQHLEQFSEKLAMMVRGPDGTIQYWDKGSEQMYGWTHDEALGHSSHRLLKTMFPKPLPEIEAQLLKTGRWEGVLIHKRRDGSKITVASRWELQRNGEEQFLTVIEINTTLLEKLRQAVVYRDVALMVRAKDGTIRYWNTGAEQLYGWSSQETLGKTSHRVLKTIFPRPLSSIEEELTKKGRWEGQLVHKRRDGSQVIVSSRWELQKAKDNTPIVIEINSKPHHLS